LAVWWVRNGVWSSEDHAIAQRIASAATSAPGLPSWNPDGRSMLGLAAQGQFTLSAVQLTPSTLSSAAGAGVLQVTNTGTQDVLVSLPYGTLITGASGRARVCGKGPSEVQ